MDNGEPCETKPENAEAARKDWHCPMRLLPLEPSLDEDKNYPDQERNPSRKSEALVGRLLRDLVGGRVLRCHVQEYFTTDWLRQAYLIFTASQH